MAVADEKQSDLGPNQQVVLYPMLGYLNEDAQTWRIMIHGRVFRTVPLSLSKRLLMRGLQRVINVPGGNFQPELFRRRLEGFLVAPEAGRRITLQVHDQVYSLRKKTRRSGQFQGLIDVPASAISNSGQSEQTQGLSLPIQLLTSSPQQDESLCGTAYLVPPSGLSIISDIDDTIKATNVTQRRAMLANTFMYPFKPIEGMPELYRQWGSQGAFFHYVSSSPWQLYDPIAQFYSDFEFPVGSMHLRWFRLRDEMFRKWQLLRRRGKFAIIANIFKRLPQRKFILVGDSGERDPEIYARLAQRFPQQVSAIIIRQIADRPLDSKRTDKLGKYVIGKPIITFTHAEEIRHALDPWLPENS